MLNKKLERKQEACREVNIKASMMASEMDKAPVALWGQAQHTDNLCLQSKSSSY